MVDFSVPYHDAFLAKVNTVLDGSQVLLWEDGSIAYYEDGVTPITIEGSQEIAWTGPAEVTTDYIVIHRMRFQESRRFNSKSGDVNQVEIHLQAYGADARHTMESIGEIVDLLQDDPVSVAGWNHILTEIRQNRALTEIQDNNRRLLNRRLLNVVSHYQRA